MKKRIIRWVVLGIAACMLLSCKTAGTDDVSENTGLEDANNVSENTGLEDTENNPEETAGEEPAEDGTHSFTVIEIPSGYFDEYSTNTVDSIISKKGEIIDVTAQYGVVSLLSGKMIYPELQESLLELDELWINKMEEIEEQGGYVSVRLDIHRADDYALSFVRRSWQPAEDGQILVYQGYHYDTMTGKELALADVITDMEGYATVMAEELAEKYGFPAGEDSLAETVKDILESGTPEWTIGYQGLAFYLPEGELPAAGNVRPLPEDHGYFIISVPYVKTVEYIEEECMDIPEAYAVSFDTCILPMAGSNEDLYQWKTYYDLDGDGTEEEIAVDYEMETRDGWQVVGEWQAVVRVDGQECVFESEWEDVSDRNRPYLIITSDGSACVVLYMQGSLDGTGCMLAAKVSDDGIEPLYHGFAYLHNMILTNPEHILTGGIVWEDIEAIKSAYFLGVARLDGTGWHDVEGKYTFVRSGEYVYTQKDITLPLVDPYTAEKTGEMLELEEGTRLEFLWIDFNKYLDCITPEGRVVRIEYSGLDEDYNWILPNGEGDCLRDVLGRYVEQE